MNSFYPLLFCAIAFNLFALKPFIQAQTDFGDIQGKVTDAETGETVPFVDVRINVDGNLVGTTTDFEGVYNSGLIPIGVYSMTFSYLGYKTVVMEEVLVGRGETNHINAKLFSAPEIINGIDYLDYGNIPLVTSWQTMTGVTARRTRSGNFIINHLY